MLVVSTFEHTLQLEQALAVLEQRGIHKESILVVPMVNTIKSKQVYHSRRGY
jgi:hypothetical protein